jgi:hypothetical protein
VEVFVDAPGQRRGRVCRRHDGRFQFVTESLTAATDECLAYWTNDYPPSGIFDSQDDAVAGLLDVLPGANRQPDIENVELDLSVGPFPEPTRR